MKPRTLLLYSLALVVMVIPASAQILYDNGPVNGTVDAWTINFGYVVSDTFTLSYGTTVTGFDFYVWAYPGDTPTGVDWSITSDEFGGSVYGSGTASLSSTYISSNQYGDDIDRESASIMGVALGAGTYWLNLQNATTIQGNPLYWDENSGPSSASESAVGTIASEAFDVTGTNMGGCPEPGSILPFGSGILGLAGVLRRRLF